MTQTTIAFAVGLAIGWCVGMAWATYLWRQRLNEVLLTRRNRLGR